MKYYRIRVNGVEYKVRVEKVEEGVYRVMVGDKEAEVFVEESYEGFEELKVRRTDTAKRIDVRRVKKVESVEGKVIEAMLPGVVVKILVSVGSKVRAGEPVMVIESMKMENEVVSPYDGVVREIRVKEGQRIEAGDVLMVIA